MNAHIEIPQRAEHLMDAFSSFIAASDRLEESHRQLHDEVARLRQELEERNRALAKSLAENERMRLVLAQILDALPCGVAVVQPPSHGIVLLNSEARRLLGLPSGELSGGFTLPDWIQTTVEAVLRGPGEQGFEQEIRLEREGEDRWLAIRYSRMATSAHADAEVEQCQIVLVIRDVTWHKKAEQEREAARKAFTVAEVSEVLAHEIRNPLGSLELLAQCLTTDPGLSDESKQCVEHLQAGVRLLAATVSNVLGFHAPGNPPLHRLELTPVLKSSLEFVRPLAKQRKIALNLQIDSNEIEINGEQNGLKQVFLNLFCNALRHTPSSGSIAVVSRVESQESGRIVAIEFTDTGRGIRREDLPHVFDPGFSTTGSSGLGLAVCRRIIEQHAGQIMARNEPGRGATLRLEIPIL
jgi:two-component system sensor histidine kinase FlrB